MAMKVCHIWDSEYPWDVRADKVSRALSEAGHEVHLCARNRDRRALTEQLPEALVHRMRPLPIGRRLDAALMFPAFFNPRWASLIAHTCRESAAQLILIRDLPLAPTACWVGRRFGLPVVLDMAENYPAMMRSLWETGIQRPLDRFVRNPRLVEAVERWTLRHIDHVLVVIEESGERLHRHYGYPHERLTVVGNTPPLARLDAVPPRQCAASSAALHLVYLGLLEKPRGIEVALRGMAIARAAGIPLRGTIVGDGMDRKAFEALSAALNLTDAVTFTGRLPHDEALAVIATGDIGLVPHLAVEAWNTTIPNKLFDYMAYGLPVLTSDARPAARVVREAHCGLVYADREPEAFAAALRALSDPAQRTRCAEAGRRAIREQHNWEIHAMALTTALEAVLRRHQSP